MSPAVFHARRNICALHCPHGQCDEYRAGKIDPANPAAFCPLGEWKAVAGKLGLGDHFEKLAKPIAVRLKLKCLDENEQLKPESKCAKRRNGLNKLGEKIGF